MKYFDHGPYLFPKLNAVAKFDVASDKIENCHGNPHNIFASIINLVELIDRIIISGSVRYANQKESFYHTINKFYQIS
jgi:hypothetical protein